MIMCDICGKDAYKETKYMHWLTLMNFINFLYSENYINIETKEEMSRCLMSLKSYAFEGEADCE